MIIKTNILGCKVNYADAQALLAGLGRRAGGTAELVATCCVTAEAEKQSRKEVRRALRRTGGSGKVLVSGCAARRDPESFRGLGDGVELVTGESELLNQRPSRGGETAAPGVPTGGTPAEDVAANGNGLAPPRTRFFLKIQDGCANRCAYCVIPEVRGAPVSVPRERILASARAAAQAGYPELVVTGINVGEWRDGGDRLPALLDELAGTPGLKRLRLSSIEPRAVTGELLEIFDRHPLIGRHLHVPLQSGDDGVLASMGRRYGRAGMARVLDDARAAVPGLNITTDVIVGFPTEDGAAFAGTLAFVEEAGFTKVHVFSYSPRPGTRAAALGDPVSSGEKKHRSQELRRLSDRLQKAHRERKLGAMSEILLESAHDARTHAGYSSDYTRFVVEGGAAGDLVQVRAEAVTEDAVRGTVI